MSSLREGSYPLGSLRSLSFTAPQVNLGPCLLQSSVNVIEVNFFWLALDISAPLDDTPVGPIEIWVKDLERAQPGGQVVLPRGP